jgi:opacity protein-like surface antigen
MAAPCLAASPRTGDIALTTAVGVHRAPVDDDYGVRTTPSASLDFHWTSRNSLRGTFGLLKLPAESTSDQGSWTAVYLTVNVSHNWFGGRWLPFVTGGAGLYGIDEGVAPDGDDDGLELGLNGGGGLEVRLTDSCTVRLEGLLHVLTGDDPGRVATASVGFKYYF